MLASPSSARRRAAPPVLRPPFQEALHSLRVGIWAERPLLALESVSEASSPDAATHGRARGGGRILVGTRSHAERLKN